MFKALSEDDFVIFLKAPNGNITLAGKKGDPTIFSASGEYILFKDTEGHDCIFSGFDKLLAFINKNIAPEEQYITYKTMNVADLFKMVEVYATNSKLF